MRAETERFTIGGVAGYPTFPGKAITDALGSTIKVSSEEQALYVPALCDNFITIKRARAGDTIVAYDDGTFDVEYSLSGTPLEDILDED